MNNSAKFSVVNVGDGQTDVENSLRHRLGVTIVEVLFAMFVILFGMVGLVALLPLASRQAGDSYMMTQGGALMQNTASEVLSSKAFAPTSERGWWYADDDRNPNPPVLPIDYNVAFSLSDLYQNLQNNHIRKNPHRIFPPNQFSIQRITRESYAFGFCLDPLFCADQFSTGWRYGAANYTHQRKSASQVLFRRTRMPFYDEHAFIDGNFVTGAIDFADLESAASAYSQVNPRLFPSDFVEFPRLVRVSYPSGSFAGGQPLPLPMPMADKMASAMSDLIQSEAIEDKSYGSLRSFQNSGSGFLKAPLKSNITWMMTMTPNERTLTGMMPTLFDVSFVVMNRRDRMFDAAPLTFTGAESYPKDEKIAYATSTSPNNLLAPFWKLGGGVGIFDLPYSTGGTLELKLWSAQLTDPIVRVGDWVLLSRKLSLGDGAGGNLKLIHRHRWYRVIGVDAREDWPRVIRVAGDAWDYPETNPDTNSAFDTTNLTHLISVLTTVTICPSVEMVYKRVVSIE